MGEGKILSNAPCCSDLFAGKAHEKLAKVIANEIANDKDCTIIGIDGGWGSGKSNLVGMVEACLDEESLNGQIKGKYHFFTYDAWGHQNDLPRRTILEELITDLTRGKEPFLKGSYWQEQLENLLAKKKKTSTKSVPRLSPAIVIIALVTALMPAINAISDLIPSTRCRLIFISSVYVLALVIIGAIQIASLREHKQKINLMNFFSELFLLYKDKITENEKYETISEREPSTKQFIDKMEEINNEISTANRFLLIVIDNMDRLPRLKVQELWSAIHSLFSEKQYSNIKVIVPFDRNHIRNAFRSEDIEESTDNKVRVYGDDFINKTFYIVYHIAPPILSGWKDYFRHQWKDAFGEEYILDNAVLQIYDMLTEDNSPRKIVSFINEFVTIKSICDARIPDNYIALFIFGRPSISVNPIKEILSPTYLGSLEYLYKDDKEIAGYMSSLFYQLPVEDAIDVVYTKQFTKELDENTPDSILQMKESGIAKIYAILNRAISDVSNTGNAAEALQTVFMDESNPDIQYIWECLYKKDEEKRGIIKIYSPYHKILLSHIEKKEEYVQDLISGYHSNFSEDTDILDYVEGIDNLAEVGEICIYDILSRSDKRVSPEQFITLVTATTDSYKQYGITCGDDELSEYLSNQDLKSWGNLTVVPYLNRDEYPLESFKSKIEENLKKNPAVGAAEILFSRLKELRRSGATINYKAYFSSDSFLDSLFNNADNRFKYDLIAMRLSASDRFNNSYGYINSTIIRGEEEIVQAVAEVSYYYVDFGELLTSLDRFNNPFVKSLCKYLTLNRVGKQSMDVKSVAKKFDVILANSDIKPEELILRMNDWRADQSDINVSDIPFMPISFFKAAKETECELSAYIFTLATNYLQSISQDEWERYLSSDNDLQFELLKLDHPTTLQPFFDAFKSLMKSYANAESDIKLKEETVEDIISVAEEMKHDVKRLFVDIRDYFLNAGITDEKLKYFGKWMFQYSDLDHNANSLEKILPSELIDDYDTIKLMDDNRVIIKEMMDNAEDSSEFREKLQSMLIGNKKDCESLQSLCSYLGITQGIE